jgi:hypothetical protein
MRKLLKYQLINGCIPSEIEDGGYFYDNTNLYGISIHLEESYTPEGMEWLSLEEFEKIITTYNDAPNPIPNDPITRKFFEENHAAFYYKTDTPKDRITILEDIVAAILEGDL